MASKNWEDIDLGGLSMEGDEPGDPTDGKKPGKSRHDRIDVEKLHQIVIDQEKIMTVEVFNNATNRLTRGTVQDVSEGGIKVGAAGAFAVGDTLRLTFNIGRRRIHTRGRIRWVKEDEDNKVLGVEFEKPDPKDIDFISSIFTAITLKKY